MLILPPKPVSARRPAVGLDYRARNRPRVVSERLLRGWGRLRYAALRNSQVVGGDRRGEQPRIHGTLGWCQSVQFITHYVELHLKTGRTPFDVNSVYLKTGKPFRAALKYWTDLYLITGQVCT
jgi:hypothetical protein